MEKKILHILFFLIVISLAIIIMSNSTNVQVSQSNKSEDKATGLAVIKFNHGDVDLLNKDQGTLVIELSIQRASIDPENKLDKVIFFSSNNIRGFRIEYDLREQNVIAGLPQVTSTKVNLFDGNRHELAYSYHKEKGQAIYLDGKLIGYGDYSGKPLGGIITGATIIEKIEEINADSKIDVYGSLQDEYPVLSN